MLVIIVVITTFPFVVEMILPDFEVGRIGAYSLEVLPLAMYVQSQIREARKNSQDEYYQTRKERLYHGLSKVTWNKN